MADRKQNQEFLGGVPKFNSVGKDTRTGSGAEEPVIPVRRAGDWQRIAGIALAVLLLATLLFYLNDRDLGRTSIQPTRGGHAVSSDMDKPVSDPNLK